MRIGIVDLDTSHPKSWVPIEREMGHEVVGLWDGGSIHPPEYAEQFAQENGIPRVYGSLEEMAGQVDCAIVHGCDWDTHIDKARPFVEAGKAVLIDKPLAGNLRDLAQLRRWCDEGARISGSSALRFCSETREWLAQAVAERGTAHTTICGCSVDEFNYGIHAYSMLSGIMGPGIESVKHLGKGVQRRIEVNWSDGRTGLLIVGKTAKRVRFFAAIVTELAVTQYEAAEGTLYNVLLEATLPYLAGQADQPMPMAELMEPELCALAARRSWLEGDRLVELSELTEDDDGYDGRAFAEEYRQKKYPSA